MPVGASRGRGLDQASYVRVVANASRIGRAEPVGTPSQRKHFLRLLEVQMRLSFRLVVVVLVAARPVRRHRQREARPRRREATDGPAVHEPQQRDQFGSRVLGEPRLHRLLHRRCRQPGRYRAPRRRTDLRHLESGQAPRSSRTSRAMPTRTIRSSGTATGTASPTCSSLAVDRTMDEPGVRRPVANPRTPTTRPRRLGGCPGLRAERRPGEPVRHRRRRWPRCTRTAAHTRSRSGRVQGRRARPQADRVRLLVSAQARADVRPGERPAGRQRPAALEDLGHRGAARRSGGSSVIAEPPISYPGDPDNQIDWCERSVTGPVQPCPIPGAIEQAARACHDIVVHVEMNMAGAACAEQGQVWEIDANGIPDTANPVVDHRRRVQLGRHREHPRSGRLLPLGDVQQRRDRPEHRRRVLRRSAARR